MKTLREREREIDTIEFDGPPGTGNIGPPEVPYGEVIPLYTGYLKQVHVCPVSCTTDIQVVRAGQRSPLYPPLPPGDD